MDANDIHDMASLTFKGRLRRISYKLGHNWYDIEETLSKLGYAEAYKKAEAEIKKAAEEARISGIVKEIPFMNKEKQAEMLKTEGDNKEVVKALFANGVDISADKLKAMFTAEELAEVRMSEKVKAGLAENEKKSAELAEAQKAIEQKEQQINAKLAETKARLDQQERDVATEKPRLNPSGQPASMRLKTLTA